MQSGQMAGAVEFFFRAQNARYECAVHARNTVGLQAVGSFGNLPDCLPRKIWVAEQHWSINKANCNLRLASRSFHERRKPD